MKKKSIAKNLLKSLEEAVEIEKGTLKGRETRMALSPPATVRPAHNNSCFTEDK